MEKFVPLGNEALAQGALDAGLSGVYAYPGTPSTEITEYIQRSKDAMARGVHRDWAANEKTAMEAALGMSYAGKRALVCMKHVGLNVAADPFMNSAVTGVNGGLLYAVADDPSMHSSQNEQDTRYYARFALIPALEPSNQQEAYDMPFYGFAFSEKYKVPVLMRITTRLSHSRADVVRREARAGKSAEIAGKSAAIRAAAVGGAALLRGAAGETARIRGRVGDRRRSTITRTAKISGWEFWRAGSRSTT